MADNYKEALDIACNILNSIDNKVFPIHWTVTEWREYCLRLVERDYSCRYFMNPEDHVTDDITFCLSDCDKNCGRKDKYMLNRTIPHSFTYFKERQ